MNGPPTPASFPARTRARSISFAEVNKKGLLSNYKSNEVSNTTTNDPKDTSRPSFLIESDKDSNWKKERQFSVISDSKLENILFQKKSSLKYTPNQNLPLSRLGSVDDHTGPWAKIKHKVKKVSNASSVAQSDFSTTDLDLGSDSSEDCDDDDQDHAENNFSTDPSRSIFDLDLSSALYGRTWENPKVSLFSDHTRERDDSLTNPFPSSSASTFNPMILLLGKISDENLENQRRSRSRKKASWKDKIKEKGIMNNRYLQRLEKHEEKLRCASSGEFHRGEEILEGCTAPEIRRQNFHCFLKESGQLGAMASVILGLYDKQELPPVEDAHEHICNILGYTLAIQDDIEEIKAFNSMLNAKILYVEAQNDLIRRRLDQYETSEQPVDSLDPGKFTPSKFQTDQTMDPPVTKILQRRKHRAKPTLLPPCVRKNTISESETPSDIFFLNYWKLTSETIRNIDTLDAMFKGSRQELDALYFS